VKDFQMIARKQAKNSKIRNWTIEADFSTNEKVLGTSIMVGGLLFACGGGGNANTRNTTAVLNQGLWVANGTNVLEFVPSQLTGATSAAVPRVMNNSSVFGAPQGVTFDSAGDLSWDLRLR
jgi:hypothetical protein